MNFSKYFLFMALIVLYMSCGSDESCSSDDWVGTWTGDIVCDDGTTESTTVIITKVDESTISLSYDGESFQINVNGCNYNSTQQIDIGFGNISIALDGKLDGDSMDFITSIDFLGQKLTCDALLSR